MTCENSCTVDDVQLHGMALRLMRDLFSNIENYGPHKPLADKFVFCEKDSPNNTLDVYDWDDRDGKTQSRPTIYVKAGDVTLAGNGNQNSEGEAHADGGGTTYAFVEQMELVFRAMSSNANEARVLSRIIADHLCGTKDLFYRLSAGQVVYFMPVKKTAPAKLKREQNVANLWACDVVVQVHYTLNYRMREVAPVLSEIISVSSLS